MPSCQTHSAQRQLAIAHAMEPVLGPHSALFAHRKHGQRAPAAYPKDRQTGEGERLTPAAPQNGEQVPLRGTPRHPCVVQCPAAHASHRASAGSPHLCIQNMWAAAPGRLPVGQASLGGRAPSLRNPSQRHEAPTPRDDLMPSDHAQHQLARARAVGSVPGPHTRKPQAQEARATGPDYLPLRQAAGTERAPNSRRCSQPRHATPSEALQADGPVPGTHACTSALTACGQRSLAACPKDRQLREDERLTPHAPQEGTRRPARRCPPATPAARNAGSQERTLWGRCRAPEPAPPAPRKHGQQAPATCPKDGHPGEGEPLTPDAAHNPNAVPPRATLRQPRSMQHPARRCKSKGQCWVPTPAHLHSEHVGSSPQLAAQRTGSRGTVSA